MVREFIISISICSIFLFANCKINIGNNACNMANIFLKEKLKEYKVFNNANADFGNCNDENKVVDLGNGHFQIVNFIDATSVSGIKDRYFFKMILKYEGGDKEKMSNWLIVDIELINK